VALSASKPLIGLTTYRQRSQTGIWDCEASFLPTSYIDAINAAGGIAVLLPPQPIRPGDAETILAGLDGLLVCGGRDVNPERYGAVHGQETDEPDLLRDALEDQLLTAAIEHNVPFLGICRGMQILNVNRGGTLIQHLPDVVGTTKYQLGNGVFSHQPIKIEAGTHLSQILSGKSSVDGALYHHQALDTVGQGLTVTATTDDNVIEAVELAGVDFGVAVQWHPEQTLEDLSLFTSLIDAALKHRSNN
jgi:putative glutamine amidotransferase